MLNHNHTFTCPSEVPHLYCPVCGLKSVHLIETIVIGPGERKLALVCDSEPCGALFYLIQNNGTDVPEETYCEYCPIDIDGGKCIVCGPTEPTTSHTGGPDDFVVTNNIPEPIITLMSDGPITAITYYDTMMATDDVTGEYNASLYEQDDSFDEDEPVMLELANEYPPTLHMLETQSPKGWDHV